MDTYQPIFDAVRSRLSNGDIGAAVETAIRDANLSHYVAMMTSHAMSRADEVAEAQMRPSVLYKPDVVRCRDGVEPGFEWCAALGSESNGLKAYGATPAAAMKAFDRAWTEQDRA